MPGALQLLLTITIVLLAAYVPGMVIVRVLGGSLRLGLGLAPALGAAIAGLGAVVAGIVGIDWTLMPFLATSAAAILLAFALARCGVALPATVLDVPPAMAPRPRRNAVGWSAALAGALLVAIGPIAAAAGSPAAVLERYDTLFHLTALQHIRLTGSGSSLELNSVANTSGAATAYPAAFHDLAALVPAVEIPIVLNGAVLALAVVPWALGIALLARALFPTVPWAAPAAAVAGILMPASPLNLWIHLSPIPNLVGFAMLPGALAAAWALWTSLVDFSASDPAGQDLAAPGVTARTRAPRSLWGAALAAVAVVSAAGIGLTLLQPNAAVTALILLAVMTAVTLLLPRRGHPLLLLVPVIALLPVAALVYTPLGARVTGFSGGLRVPLWQALGEVGLGLLTVWPMAFGVVLAVLWWPGLVRVLRGPQLWVAAAWLVIAVMYLDAAVDSPLGLSILYFRGQDRLAIPLAMLSAVLVVPGVQAWAGSLLPSSPRWRRPLAAVLIVAGILAAVGSIPARSDYAAKNLSEEYRSRGRFLQPGELEAFARAAPEMDPSKTVLASPYSGASHMYALLGIPSRFPVAGVALSDEDRVLMESVSLAGSSPEHCRLLEDAGIGYIYQEQLLYQYDSSFTPLLQGGDDLGPVLFETGHSRLIEVDCDSGR